MLMSNDPHRHLRAGTLSDLSDRVRAAMKSHDEEWWRRANSADQSRKQTLIGELDSVGERYDAWLAAYRADCTNMLRLAHRDEKLGPATEAAAAALIEELRTLGYNVDER
jgi:hypothetical protein